MSTFTLKTGWSWARARETRVMRRIGFLRMRINGVLLGCWLVRVNAMRRRRHECRRGTPGGVRHKCVQGHWQGAEKVLRRQDTGGTACATTANQELAAMWGR